jgi:tetratricopeptide (TPR) repeat protein
MNFLSKAIIITAIPLTIGLIPTVASSQAPLVIISQASAIDFYRIANDFFENEDYKGAIEAYTQAIKLNANFAEAYQSRCLSRLLIRDYPAALVDCNNAIRIRPDYADAYRVRGTVRLGFKDIRATVADWQTAANLYNAQGDRENFEYMMNRLKNVQQELQRIQQR